MNTYCGYIKDADALRRSTSGGLATALSRRAIADGAVVYGVAYAEDFKSCAYVRVTDEAGLVRLQGTKYVRPRLDKGTLDALVGDLEGGRGVLFIGLPCDVGAALAYVKRTGADTSRLLTADLICQGPTTPRVAEQFVDAVEKKYRSRIKTLSMRYKKKAWKPAYLHVEFENGKVFEDIYGESDYGLAVILMPNSGCYNCKFKGEAHVADMTLGDFWGTDKNTAGYNAMGTSLVFARSERAERALARLDNFELFPADTKTALENNPRYSTSTKKYPRSEKFKSDFERHGLHRAAEGARSLRTRIRRKTPKFILKMLGK